MMSRTSLAIGAALIVVAVAAGAYWLWLAFRPAEDRLVLRPAAYADLTGWGEDAQAKALAAFVTSCAKLLTLPDDRLLGGDGYGGRAADWRVACETAAMLPPDDSAVARAYFEQFFAPVEVRNNRATEGLFTGYYEPGLNGSRRRQGPYQVPLYLKPPDLVMVDLGRFREDLKGRRIAGRVVDGVLAPYPDRAAIQAGVLDGHALELLWVDDAVDAFFLQIQGSGRVRLDDGTVVRVGYAAQNGHPYVAIGRELIDRGAVPREQMSMQAIRDWLVQNPDQAAELFAVNPSFVFFRELGAEGPLGAQGVTLTPERSLAVDRKWHALGVPVWLDAAAPGADGAAERSLRRLMVAQDTGGAIRGPVRGDVFWGHGEEATLVAGGMKHPGRMWLLLPKPLALRLAAAD